MQYGLMVGVSSAASGGDTLFLEELARRKLPARVLLPFARTRFEKDFSPEEWRRVATLLDQVMIVEELEEADSTLEAYHEAGALTVERSDVMVFLWDGHAAAGEGGTGDMVEYARGLAKPMIIVDPSTGNVTEERMPQSRNIEAMAEWPSMPREAVEQQFHAMNDKALHHAPRARRLILRIIMLHLLASAIGIGALLFFASEALVAEATKHRISNIALVVEIVVLALAAMFATQLRRSHHEWIHNRLGAELCRSFLAAWKLRRRPASFPRMTIEGFERLAASLRVAWYLDRNASPDFNTAREVYFAERIQGQIDYYTTAGRNASRALHRWRTVASVATLAAIIATSAALGLSIGHLDAQMAYPLVKLGSLLLPLVNAAALALIIAMEYSRRVVRYEQMAVKLRRVAQQIRYVKTWPALFRLAVETEDELLAEVMEWHSYLRFAGDSH
jgi:hypothetical protein